MYSKVNETPAANEKMSIAKYKQIINKIIKKSRNHKNVIPFIQNVEPKVETTDMRKGTKVSLVCKANAIKLEEKQTKQNRYSQLYTERSKRAVKFPKINTDREITAPEEPTKSIQYIPKKHKLHRKKKKIFVTTNSRDEYISSLHPHSSLVENYGNNIN